MSEENLDDIIELSVEEFLKVLNDEIDFSEQELKNMIRRQEELIGLYRNAYWDSKKYYLKCYRQGDELKYLRGKKRRVGFKYGQKDK